MTFLPVLLALGVAGIRLRQRFPRIMRVLAPQPSRPQRLFAELQRIETDPAYRALFLTGLDAAIVRRDAERTAELHAVEAAAGLLQHLVHPESGPGPGPGPGPGERDTDADVAYVAELTVSAGTAGTRRTVSLGRVTVPNRRLALRWLRRQALRLADAHGHLIPPDTTPWTQAIRDVRPVTFHGSDAPEALRAWATDDQCQADALHRLASGPHTLLTVTDPAVGLHISLTGQPHRPNRTADPRHPTSPRPGRVRSGSPTGDRDGHHPAGTTIPVRPATNPTRNTPCPS
ncbi:hypothetical protein [Streptomyces sp. BE147]|uniref:hypothetical protein n=1 Tax=Streptomyces sp. BE147 TaxID=3002524 RepID=UPI002E77A028|nr:hypothetical protein [Streptomyces sp. BE147]